MGRAGDRGVPWDRVGADQSQGPGARSCEARGVRGLETGEAREAPEARSVGDRWGHRARLDPGRMGKEDQRSQAGQAETDLGND